MRRSGIFVGMASVAVAAVLAACLVTIDDSKIGSDAGSDASFDALADSPTDAASDAVGDARLDALDGGCPAGMVAVPTPDAAAPGYCIDSTEVTLSAYGAFLAAAEPPAPNSQRVECDWNTTYTPPNWSGGMGDRPVTELDWCDAFAYCAWAGKRLCGRIGGGPVDLNGGATNAPESQWFNACSRGGTQTYPYAGAYDGGACVGGDYTSPSPIGPLPAKQASACVGGFAGLFDMSGNAGELIDSCTTEKICDGGHECELCALIGGSFHDKDVRLECAYVNEVRRDGQYDDNGVRCCWP